MPECLQQNQVSYGPLAGLPPGALRQPCNNLKLQFLFPYGDNGVEVQCEARASIDMRLGEVG